MANTVTVEENQWNDPVREDTLFSPLAKGLFWSGFGILALALLVMSVLSFSFYLEVTKDARVAPGSDFPSTITPMMVFLMIYNLGTLVFSSGFVVGSLAVSRAPAWARVTMLSVAGVLLVGATALSTIFLGANWN